MEISRIGKTFYNFKKLKINRNKKLLGNIHRFKQAETVKETEKPKESGMKQVQDLPKEKEEKPFVSSIDVDLGVPPHFNPFDQNYDFDTLNQMLGESIYHFIFKLLGTSVKSESRYKQFIHPKECLIHPFLAKGFYFLYRS